MGKFDAAKHLGRLRREEEVTARIDRLKAAVVVAVSQGIRVCEFERVLGVKASSYAKWRQHDPAFRARIEVARSGGIEAGDTGSYRGDFATFRKIFLGMDTFPHQARLVQILDTVKPREIILVNMHPESGKTTTVTDWITKTIAEDPNHRITYVSRSIGLGKKVIAQVQRRLTDPHEYGALMARFGPFFEVGQEREGKPWNQTAFTVAGATHDERDYTMEVRGWNSAAYGTRIDTLIVDDIQSLETLGQTTAILDSLRHTYFTRGRRMRVVIIGTRLSGGDLYERLIDTDIVTHHVDLPAALPSGEPCVPEWWLDPDEREGMSPADVTKTATERLAVIRHQVGEPAWFAEYQQRPNADTLASFTEETLEDVKDVSRVVGQASDPHLPTAAGIDPALGGVNAITIGALTEDRLEILDCIADKNFARTEDIISRIRDVAGVYRISVLVVEVNAFQKALAADDRLRQVARDYGFQVIEHSTSRNKADPTFGVASMAGAMMRNEISLPAGDPRSIEIMAPLISELRAWRPDVPPKLLLQDRVMSLWFLWRHWARLRENRTAVSRSSWGRRGVLWTPMSVGQPLKVNR